MNKRSLHRGSNQNTLDRGLKLHQSGDFEAAELFYLDFLKSYPVNKQVHFLLGLLASQTQRPLMAKNHLEIYLKDQPNDTQATGVLALAHFELGNFETAQKLFRSSIEQNRNSPSLFHNLGQACFQLQQYEEAIQAHRSALSLEPDYIKAHIGLGISLRELKSFEEARMALSKAIELDPTNAEAYFFYGNVLRDLNDLQASIGAYETALKYKPDYIEATINCGNSYKDLGLAIEAIHCYDMALKLNHTHPEANYNKSLVLLNNAHFAEGWPLYEWRFKSAQAQQKFVNHAMLENIAPWDGQTLNGKLLVLPEQGIGDQVFFLGMLSDLKQKVQALTVCVDSRLITLFERSYPDVHFVHDASSLSSTEFDAQIHIGSLGQYLRREESSFSKIPSPYLLADASHSSALRNSIKRNGNLVCGLSWLSKNADHGQAKSLNLSNLKGVLTLSGFDFLDLQYGDTQQERDQFQSDHGVTIFKQDAIDNFHDIDGLASLIDACDLIITVSNTTAHLACALGKPTLVLLPQTSAVFWYWYTQGMQTAWYPTAVLLRQQELGDWPEVVQAVCQILQGMSSHAIH